MNDHLNKLGLQKAEAIIASLREICSDQDAYDYLDGMLCRFTKEQYELHEAKRVKFKHFWPYGGPR